VQLRERDRQADPGEHAVHHGGWDGVDEAGDAEHPEGDLQQPRPDGDETGDLPAEPDHQLRDHHGETGGRPGDLQGRAAEQPGHDRADDRGDEARHDRRPRGECDAERERHRDEEHDDRRAEVGPQALETCAGRGVLGGPFGCRPRR
jgi:hypothetical protein